MTERNPDYAPLYLPDLLDDEVLEEAEAAYKNSPVGGTRALTDAIRAAWMAAAAELQWTPQTGYLRPPTRTSQPSSATPEASDG